MARVYLANDESLDRMVAIKMMSSELSADGVQHTPLQQTQAKKYKAEWVLSMSAETYTPWPLSCDRRRHSTPPHMSGFTPIKRTVQLSPNVHF